MMPPDWMCVCVCVCVRVTSQVMNAEVRGDVCWTRFVHASYCSVSRETEGYSLSVFALHRTAKYRCVGSMDF